MPTTSRPCCDQDTCIRTELATLLEPDSSIVDRICVAACVVAQTCGTLGPDDLHSCASKLFDVYPECELTSAFVLAYQTERDAIAERRKLEKCRADTVGRGGSLSSEAALLGEWCERGVSNSHGLSVARS